MKFVRAVTTFLVCIWAVNQVNGQLSRTSPPPGGVVCPEARVEYTCQTGESGGTSILTWSIDGVDLAPFFGLLSMLPPGSTRNFSGGVATLTGVSLSGLTSTFVIDSAGENITNLTVIGCGGTNIKSETVTLIIVSTEVTSVTAPLSPGLTLSYVQVGVATSDAEMCTDTVYCVDVPDAGLLYQCMQSRTISLPQELNMCQTNYTVVGSVKGDNRWFVVDAVRDLNVLGNLTNIRTNSSHLLWSPPANRPEDCISGYEISWGGVRFMHSPSNENMPSVSFDVLEANGFPVCQIINVTISPFLPALGVIKNKGGSFKRGGAIENITEVPRFNTSRSVSISVGWNPFYKAIRSGDGCYCMFGKEIVDCDPIFSRCVWTVKNGSELFNRKFSYSIFIDYKDCPPLSDSGTITAPTLITDAPMVNISGTSVTLTLNLNSAVVCDITAVMVTTDPHGPLRSLICSDDNQLIVSFRGLDGNTEHKYTIAIQSHQPVYGVFVTGSPPPPLRRPPFPWRSINKKHNKKSKASDEETVELQ